MVNIAINGFGRIGRMVLRALLEYHTDINVVCVNDLTDIGTLANLFKYDSTHTRFAGTVETAHDGLVINGKHIRVTAEKDPSNLPWKEMNVDIVAECTGFFRTEDKLKLHIQAGAKKVILSAPAKGGNVPTFVLGVNEHDYKPEEHNIISNASCTTNSLAPVVKVLDDNFGLEQGFMTTIHSYTADQKIVDAPHGDQRRGRAAAVNIVPTTTGAAKAVTKVIPHLKGKLDGVAVRVPSPDGSLTDFTATLKKEATKEKINELFKNVANKELKNVLEYTQDPIVSRDIVDNPHSGIFDASLTMVNGKQIKVFSWYDNEWGYSCRMGDLIKMMAEHM